MQDVWMKVWASKAEGSVIVLRTLVLGMALLAGVACSDGPAATSAATPERAPTASTESPADPSPSAATRNVLVMGDSLSAAYNLSAEQGWVALLDAQMRTEAPQFRMVNASISGETTAGGKARIDAALAQHRPDLVVIELGANDGLRGLPLEESRRNLEAMVSASKAAGAEVLLLGMRLPPNYGPDYTEGFFNMFAEISAAESTGYLPFFLEPIAADDAAFQADLLHPTAEAQPKLAAHVWEVMAPMLRELAL